MANRSMMQKFNHRPVNMERDREILLDFHFQAIYESGTPWARLVPIEKAKEWWYRTSQVEAFFSGLIESLKDERTIAEIWEDGNSPVAYVWVRFNDIKDYNLVFAEVEDISVSDGYRRQGVGEMIMKYVEKLAIERGANILRSSTGVENIGSIALHNKVGFKVVHMEYEKLLDNAKDILGYMNL